MRITLLAILCIVTSTSKASSGKASAFKHHVIELFVSPSVDYYFITYPNRSPNYKSLTQSLYHPFIGGNVALSYTYRPIQYFGISTGFNYLDYVNKMGTLPTTEFNANGQQVQTTLIFKGYMQWGYINVPIYLHTFFSIKKVAFNCSTGPQFTFPVYTFTNNISYTPYYNQSPISLGDKKQRYTPSEMRKDSWLGWNIQASVVLPVKGIFSISVGPEVTFITVTPLEPGPYYSQLTHQISLYAGVKLGFRLEPGNGAKKKSAAQPEKKT
jgi:hypothetical protein